MSGLFKKKSWVCLVTPEVLEAERALQKAQFSEPHHQDLQLQKALWREIDVTATTERIIIELGDVNEEVVLGGIWTGCFKVRTLRLCWDDLCDFEVLARLFEHEQVGVMRAAAQMLAELRESSAAQDQLLAA